MKHFDAGHLDGSKNRWLCRAPTPERCHQRSAERLGQALQRITRRAQLLVSGRKIKETGLHCDLCVRHRNEALNQAQA